MTKEHGVGEDLNTMLNFYHDIGKVVYFGHRDKSLSSLKDIVILNPQWLIDVFKRVITVCDPQKTVTESDTIRVL